MLSPESLCTLATISDLDEGTTKTEQTALKSIPFENIVLLKLLDNLKFPCFLGFSSSKKKYFTVKIFDSGYDASNRCFRNEKRFSKFKHINIIKVFSTNENIPLIIEDQIQSVSCIIMEHTPHENLLSFFKKNKEEFTDKLARTYFRQLIEGLEYLHNSGACHFDLKLENLFIGEDGQLKIANFNLSYMKGDQEIVSSGTRFYRAPEIKVSKKTSGPAADIYSAGIILFLFKCRGVLPQIEGKLYKNYDLLSLLNTDTKGFFDAHCTLQNKKPSFFDQDFKELFISMTKSEPEARITIQKIKESKWYKRSVYSCKELEKKVNKLSD